MAAAKNGNDVVVVASPAPPIVIPNASSPSICKSPEFASKRILSVEPSLPNNVLPIILKLAMRPPLNNTFDPVICPDAERIKFLLEDLIPIELISNPAISPPSNKTLEPVI